MKNIRLFRWMELDTNLWDWDWKWNGRKWLRSRERKGEGWFKNACSLKWWWRMKIGVTIRWFVNIEFIDGEWSWFGDLVNTSSCGFGLFICLLFSLLFFYFIFGPIYPEWNYFIISINITSFSLSLNEINWWFGTIKLADSD